MLTTRSLADWGNFFTIVGSSAGALTGLMFVAIALRRDIASPVAARAMHTFATPTVVHFATVLALSALQSMPGISGATLGVILMALATIVFAYVLWALRNARTFEGYKPDLEDWTWHFFLPGLSYVGLFIGGTLSWSAPNASRYVVGGSMLVLLVSGIHNAWDSAIYTIITRSNSS
ncbi:MAG: hypothetical protein ACYDCC_08765 [Actinomycetota bacterium]